MSVASSINQYFSTRISGYQSIAIPTYPARTNLEINSAGRRIEVISAPTNVLIRMHDSLSPVFNLEAGQAILDEFGFQKFYVTFNAVSDKYIELFVSDGIKKENSTSIIPAKSSLELYVTCTLSAVVYPLLLPDNTKQLIICNTHATAKMNINFGNAPASIGFKLLPEESKIISAIDFDSMSLYVDSTVAGAILSVQVLT